MRSLVKCFSSWKNGLRSSFFLFMLAGMMGCRSVERVEMVTVTDTLRIVVTDTVVRIRVVEVKDTVRIRVTDSVVVKVDADGTVSKERYHDEDRLRTEDRLQTTDNRQRTEEDILRTTDNRQQTTEDSLRTEETWRDRLLDRTGVIGLAVLILGVGFLVRKIIK